MREIKFRAWDNENGCFEEATHRLMVRLDGQIYNSEYGDTFEDRYKIMQYTGLKDKNGKEIYAGDIISCLDDGSKFVVIYNNKRASFVLSEINSETGHYEKYDDKFVFLFNVEYFHSTLNDTDVEVIGNVYENKELLNDN